jgi:hypothetical protein
MEGVIGLCDVHNTIIYRKMKTNEVWVVMEKRGRIRWKGISCKVCCHLKGSRSGQLSLVVDSGGRLC